MKTLRNAIALVSSVAIAASPIAAHPPDHTHSITRTFRYASPDDTVTHEGRGGITHAWNWEQLTADHVTNGLVAVHYRIDGGSVWYPLPEIQRNKNRELDVDLSYVYGPGFFGLSLWAPSDTRAAGHDDHLRSLDAEFRVVVYLP